MPHNYILLLPLAGFSVHKLMTFQFYFFLKGSKIFTGFPSEAGRVGCSEDSGTHQIQISKSSSDFSDSSLGPQQQWQQQQSQQQWQLLQWQQPQKLMDNSELSNKWEGGLSLHGQSQDPPVFIDDRL